MSEKKIDFPSRAARRDYLLKKELSEGGFVDIVTENTDSIEFSGDGSKESPLKAEAVGLGSAATKDVGTTEGTVAAGDDLRITGALQKSANLSDLNSAATARTNLGLGTAATRDVGEGLGNVLGVGSFGIGGSGRDLAMDEDIQQVTTGIYIMQNSHPQNEWDAVMSLIVSRSGEFGAYIACHTSSNKIYYTSGHESASLDWGELVFIDDVQRIVDEAVDKALNP